MIPTAQVGMPAPGLDSLLSQYTDELSGTETGFSPRAFFVYPGRDAADIAAGYEVAPGGDPETSHGRFYPRPDEVQAN